VATYAGKRLMIRLAVSTQYRRVTDGQTSCDSIFRAMHAHRAVKTLVGQLSVRSKQRCVRPNIDSFVSCDGWMCKARSTCRDTTGRDDDDQLS